METLGVSEVAAAEMRLDAARRLSLHSSEAISVSSQDVDLSAGGAVRVRRRYNGRWSYGFTDIRTPVFCRWYVHIHYNNGGAEMMHLHDRNLEFHFVEAGWRCMDAVIAVSALIEING